MTEMLKGLFDGNKTELLFFFLLIVVLFTNYYSYR